MNWVIEAHAVFQAGFGFLARNYAECSSTQLLQATLLTVAVVGITRIAVRGIASERMSRGLEPIDLQCEPTLAAALKNARQMANFGGLIGCYWAKGNSVLLATLGYVSPSLIIGRAVTEALAREELEAALAHELSHARRRDALRLEAWRLLFVLGLLSLIFAVLLFLVFYVGAFGIDRPLALTVAAASLAVAITGGGMSAAYLERSAELACDGAAAAGPGGPLTAAAALVKVARLEKGAPRLMPACAMPLFSADTFQLRVNNLIQAANGEAARRPRRSGLRLAGSVALAACVLAVAQPVDMERAAADGCSTCALVVKKSAHWAD